MPTAPRAHRSPTGSRSIERRRSWRWRWAERVGEWDTELWRHEDEATQRAAGGARPALDVVRPLAQFDDGNPWATAIGQLEA